MPDPAYESVVKETFVEKPLRTVLIIDDEFPTYSDLADPEQVAQGGRKYRQKDLALALYRFFEKRHMLCDIDNVLDSTKVERIRKSDLVVLDYHLGPGDNNSDRAIRILRELVSSKHFNTVVVYTAEPNQDRVWLEIISSVAAGWRAAADHLEGADLEQWEMLGDEGKLPRASQEMMMAFAKRRDIRDLGALRGPIQRELTDLGVAKESCTAFITAMIERELAPLAGRYAAQPPRPAVGGYNDGRRWIQSGNAFITVLRKDTGAGGDPDPIGIIPCLEQALLAWRPNLIQIITSEIQNVLELEALATEDDYLRDPVTHTALSYYLLNSIGLIDTTNENVDLRAPLIGILDKVVEGVRRRLSTDPALITMATSALLGELRDTGWSQETWPKPRSPALFQGALTFARTENRAKQPETLFRLNSFFSTEKFRRAHITNGTVFYHRDRNEYFVAASPACDLVARRPADTQVWAHSIFPITPMLAILLHPDEIDPALSSAEVGLHIFSEADGVARAFKVVHGTGNQPSYEFFMLKGEGRVREAGGVIVFDAARLTPVPAGTPGEVVTTSEWTDGTFEVVDQLRAMNATRILQLAGQHLSRIGLDFLGTPKRDGPS